MKIVEVVAGVICEGTTDSHDTLANDIRYLATQRGYGEYSGSFRAAR